MPPGTRLTIGAGNKILRSSEGSTRGRFHFPGRKSPTLVPTPLLKSYQDYDLFFYKISPHDLSFRVHKICFPPWVCRG